MALIFGRFDKADKQVREAIVQLSVPETGDPSQFIPPSRVIFEHAVDLFPDATASDLSWVVSVLVQEGKHLGFLGERCLSQRVRARFEMFIYRKKPGYRPTDEERFITLAELSALGLGNSKSGRMAVSR